MIKEKQLINNLIVKTTNEHVVNCENMLLFIES
jgi:hypothetical protein